MSVSPEIKKKVVQFVQDANFITLAVRIGGEAALRPLVYANVIEDEIVVVLMSEDDTPAPDTMPFDLLVLKTPGYLRVEGTLSLLRDEELTERLTSSPYLRRHGWSTYDAFVARIDRATYDELLQDEHVWV